MAFFESKNLRIEKPSDHFALLLFDVADRSVNVFNKQVLADLEAAFEHLTAERSIHLLGIRSAKPSKSFAGADLHEFAAVTSAEEAAALSALGQRVFNKLAELPQITVISLHGPCVGGGLEFALACDYRLVLDRPYTQLGLPEVQLGLVPGWGGTQRLPRRVGLERALHIILGGKQLSAQAAKRWGLADAVAASEVEQAAVLRLLGQRALVQGKRPAKRLPLLNWRQRLLESNPLSRSLVFRAWQRVLARRVPDDMPAPAEALQALMMGLKNGMEAGLAYEREANGRLATTRACRHLVSLFFEREQARKVPEAASRIQRVGVVGAGVMGAGIAQLASIRGCDVVVREVNEAALAAGMDRIAALFQKAVERHLLSAEEAQQKLAAIGRTTGWQGFENVDLVVEAVVEDLGLKQTLFRDLEQHTRPGTILATNTSSLLVRQLQEGRQRPERVAGVHFFNPVHKMPLVEVVRGPATSESALPALCQWAVALGKTPVVVKDSPGFVVNRILMPYLYEAIVLAAQRIRVDLIDRTMRRFGMLVGPLELLDQVGLDVAAHVARAMQPIFGERLQGGGYPGIEDLAQTFARMQENGWLGQKTGVGFYRYRGKAKKVNRAALKILPDKVGPDTSHLLSDLPREVQMREARERMVLGMVNEAAACLSEELAADAETLDLAMVLGTSWAPHRGGPLHYADDLGPAEVVQRLSALRQRLGARFEPCDELRRRAAAREPFCKKTLAEARS
jgi:3-hydroxyacyl-CoA dehydrogenase/enoyl-CoA hydratase/3-hydroxybutyryl-CoA epimerase